ncbi:hypothetical protein K439DRAFT_1331533, partial [Ramaria rubella]
QSYLEDHGHIALFLLKFHCELAPIKLYWGWSKHKYCVASDSKFMSVKILMPKMLDSVDVNLIFKFFF